MFIFDELGWPAAADFTQARVKHQDESSTASS
jgi:hypothetical protein